MIAVIAGSLVMVETLLTRMPSLLPSVHQREAFVCFIQSQAIAQQPLTDRSLSTILPHQLFFLEVSDW